MDIRTRPVLAFTCIYRLERRPECVRVVSLGWCLNVCMYVRTADDLALASLNIRKPCYMRGLSARYHECLTLSFAMYLEWCPGKLLT